MVRAAIRCRTARPIQEDLVNRHDRPAQLASLSALSLALVVSCTPSGAPSTSTPLPTRLVLVAGTPSGLGNVDGPRAAAKFSEPAGVATDGAGNLYVADCWNGAIRMISPAGVVTTVAADRTFDTPLGVAVVGTTIYVAEAGEAPGSGNILAFQTGTTLSSQPQPLASNNPFSHPVAVAVDSRTGAVFAADFSGQQVYMLPYPGASWTPMAVPADGGYGNPNGVAVDADDNVYVADPTQQAVYEIACTATSPALTYATTTTSLPGAFGAPISVAVDASGDVFLADAGSNGVLEYVPGAGAPDTGTTTLIAGGGGHPGAQDGTGPMALFAFDYTNDVGGLTLDAHGHVYVADALNNTIREVAPGMSGGVPSAAATTVSTVAGSAVVQGYADGPGAAATFAFSDPPYTDASAPPLPVRNDFSLGDALANVAVDGSGNIILADSFNGLIRKITPQGVVSSPAGDAAATGPEGDGLGAAAIFDGPCGVAVAPNGTVYVSDASAGSIRALTPDVSGAYQVATLEPVGTFTGPVGLALDASGNLYVACAGLGGQVVPGVYMLNTAAATPPPVTAVCTEFLPGATAFSLPIGVAANAQGMVYVTDYLHDVVVQITPGAPSHGQPTWTGSVLAGRVDDGGYGDGPVGTNALFYGPAGLALDPVSGYLLVADLSNNVVRVINPSGDVNVGTAVGTHGAEGSVPGLLPSSLLYPMGLAVNPLTRALVITVPDAVFQTE
jgi:sugar lactone lactonase YvrE